ncbi:tail fiber domain-containing protein [Microcoleus sp. CAWBG58]|uniref:tail fiber domain-containing protein n=1 Tax=Microcoleus sp. CAWBG58 TaxID=2841651 RepID=UPI0025DE0175|nr:tail fiber domain-containing protein [Microcoleus sp. CAWBG58]
MTLRNPITEPQIPGAIARDSEVTAAVNAHLAAADPHAQYLLQSEGDARYRQSSTALTDADIPSTIARDSEVTAAVNAHLAAADPHAQYLLQSEGDARYRRSSSPLLTSAPFPTANVAGNSNALSWNSVEPGLGIAEFCNYSGLGGGDAFNFFRLPGNAVSPPTLANRVARIDVSGAYIQTSDKRVKKNHLPSPGLATILSLSPKKYQHYECVNFNLKDKKFELGEKFVNKIGFFAQEVSQVIPEAVSGTGADGELYGIDYSCIVACLVKAVQEQQAQISKLDSQLKSSSKI